MNLRTFILGLTICSGTASFAQTPEFFNSAKQNKLHRHISALLHKQAIEGKQAKTTATRERLVGQGSILPNGMPYDSVSYQYSGQRGSVYDLNFMRYNDIYSININPTSYPYLPGRLDVKADTSSHWENVSGSLAVEKSTRTTYTTDDAISLYKEFHYYQGSYDWGDEDHHLYNNGVLQVIRTFSDYSSGSMAPLDSTSMQYDNQGRLIKMLVYSFYNAQWNLAATTTHTYNSGGHLASLKTDINFNGSWMELSELIHTYYPDGKLRTVITYEHDAGVLVPAIKDSFEYVSGAPYFSKLHEYFYNPTTQQWKNGNRIEKHINQQMLPDTITYYNYDDQLNVWATTTKLVATYTNFGNPATISVYSDPLGSGSLPYAGIYRYHYEQYNVTGVEQGPEKSAFRLYPNPATDNITLQLPSDTRNARITVTDLSGKVLRSADTEGNNISLSVHDLAPGLYLVHVSGNEGSKTLRFIKQ